MKSIITFIIFVTYLSIEAQQKLDTIYANEKMNVALFFPEPIRQGITGASNFVFTYNREKEQDFGLLQATPGIESNLLAVTKNGQVYSYILKYKKELAQLNYFITSNASIRNKELSKEKPKLVVQSKNIYEERISYFGKFSEHLLKRKYRPITTKGKSGVKLQLQKLEYNTSEVYLVMEIKNKSNIDFEVDYLDVYQVNGNKRHKASFQRLRQNVIYRYKMPDLVKSGEKKRFVLVLPKFVLGDNEYLEVILRELKGSRSVVLKKG